MSDMRRILYIILALLVIQVVPVGGVGFTMTYPYQELPMMDVWFDGGGNYTYVNFFELKESLSYEVTLLDTFGEPKSGPHELTAAIGFNFKFDVPIEPDDHIILDYKINEMERERLLDYAVLSIGVTEVNINTDIISGYATPGDPIEVTVFVGEENPISYMRRCDTSSGFWSADFSIAGEPLSGGLSDPLDLTTASTGVIVQKNADGNATIKNWWAPHPEFAVNPKTDELGGEGWSGEVKIVFNPGTDDEQTYWITPDPANGKFENVSFDIDIYPGQTIQVSDYMIEKTMVVSPLAIEWLNIATDQAMLRDLPNAYVQLFVLSGSINDGIVIEAIVDGNADDAGMFLADFSVAGTSPYDLTSDSWGFVRNYNDTGDATMFEWHASDFAFVPGDLNGDGLVDKSDQKLMVSILSGKLEPSPLQLSAADLNGDGKVDSKDLKLMNKLIR